jgi:hypothetical protein
MVVALLSALRHHPDRKPNLVRELPHWVPEVRMCPSHRRAFRMTNSLQSRSLEGMPKHPRFRS